MTETQSGLRGSVEPLLGSKIDREQAVALYESLLLYTFRGCTQADIRRVLDRKGIEFDFLSWRLALRSNGLLMKNCKVFAYQFYCGNAPSAKTAGIPMKDRNTIGGVVEESRALRKHFKYLVDYGAQPLSIPELDRQLTEAVYSKDVTAYMNHIVRTKLGFLTASYGHVASDFVDDLRIGALYTLLRSYPRYEDLGHMKAICKSQAHNQAINIIKTNTASSRQRLRQNHDGTYSSLMVPLASFGADQTVTDEGSGTDSVVSSYLVTGIDGTTQSSWEQKFALSELSSSPQLSIKQRTFLSLMSGNPNAEFSAFLGMDNTEAVETLKYTAYMKKVCVFLGVPIRKAQAFLHSLQRVL